MKHVGGVCSISAQYCWMASQGLQQVVMRACSAGCYAPDMTSRTLSLKLMMSAGCWPLLSFRSAPAQNALARSIAHLAPVSPMAPPLTRYTLLLTAGTLTGKGHERWATCMPSTLLRSSTPLQVRSRVEACSCFRQSCRDATMSPLKALRFSGRFNVIWLACPLRALIFSRNAGILLPCAMGYSYLGVRT